MVLRQVTSTSFGTCPRSQVNPASPSETPSQFEHPFPRHRFCARSVSGSEQLILYSNTSSYPERPFLGISSPHCGEWDVSSPEAARARPQRSQLLTEVYHIANGWKQGRDHRWNTCHQPEPNNSIRQLRRSAMSVVTRPPPFRLAP
jgi:hypothetical protein